MPNFLKAIQLEILFLFASLLTIPFSERAWADGIKDFGIKKGMPYPRAKAILLKKGWRAGQAMLDLRKPLAESPEVGCRPGTSGECSVIFIKGRQSIGILLKERKGRYTVFAEAP